jgi:DNA processing protein
MIQDERLYQIALGQISGIGPVLYRRLVHHCGSASAVFNEKSKLLEQIPGVGTFTASLLKDKYVLQCAERELAFIEKHTIQLLFFEDKSYPHRLLHCYDAPPLLYYRGNADLNHRHIISIVGTRKPSQEGMLLCAQLVEGLAQYDVLVVSGLAFGIDTIAHRTAVEMKIPTVGVLAHGLDKLYPEANRSLAKRMLRNGGLLSDYPSGTIPDKENFPMRNRIVAGISDAILVVESGLKGGSLITAEYGNNYNRDVFALPGRITDEKSTGCLQLIRANKAALVSSATEIAQVMNWTAGTQVPMQAVDMTTGVQLDPDEKQVLDMMRGQIHKHVDEIAMSLHRPPLLIGSLLMNLEFNGLVRSMPGGFYRLNGCAAQAVLG